MSRLTLVLLLCAAIALPALAAEPTYPCFRASQAPAIDGVVLDDPAWEDVPGVTGFYALGGDYTVAKQSTARACWDDANLYVSVVCEEPDIAAIKPLMRDGDGLWSEESVEFFVEPIRNGAIYQIVVNTGGARTFGTDTPFVEGLRAAAHRGEAHYSVELAIPLAGIEADLHADQWHVAFCRNIWTYTSGGDKFTCWPALRSQFREPASFALLQVSDGVASPQRCAAAERALNADYRTHLVAQVQALTQAADDYLPVLRRAARDQAYPLRAEARETVMTWWRVLRLAEGAGDAPMGELREAASIANELRERSHNLKYAYLIEVLLEG